MNVDRTMTIWGQRTGNWPTVGDTCRRRLQPPRYRAPQSRRSAWRFRLGRQVAGGATAKQSARRTGKIQALEAVLFLAQEPLSSRKLSQYANLADGTEALTLIRQLNRLYDTEGRAFRIEQVAGGHRLLTRVELSDWVRRVAGVPGEVRLSAPAMETLAVVAYRQPVMRAEIESIRGVACGEVLRQLMERDLVRIEGRSEELGRPYLYGTTSQFLHVFGLNGLDDLPRADLLRGDLADALAAIGSEADSVSKTEENEVTALPTTEEALPIATLAASNDPLLQQTVGELDEDEDLDEEFDDDDDDDDDEDDEDFDEDFDEDYDDDYDDDDWDEDEDEEEEEDEDELDEFEDEADSEWEEVEDEDDEVEDEEDDEDEEWDEDEEDDEDEEWEEDAPEK